MPPQWPRAKGSNDRQAETQVQLDALTRQSWRGTVMPPQWPQAKASSGRQAETQVRLDALTRQSWEGRWCLHSGHMPKEATTGKPRHKSWDADPDVNWEFKYFSNPDQFHLLPKTRRAKWSRREFHCCPACHMHQVSALTLYLLLHQASDLYINSTQKQMVQMIVLLALMHGWIVKKRILALASWNGTTANNTPVRFSSDFIFPSWSLILHPAGLAQVSWPLCHSMFDNSRLRKHVKFVKLLSYFLQKTSNI